MSGLRSVLHGIEYCLNRSGIQLAAVFLLALGVRMWGVQFGLPYVFDPDEPWVVPIAVRFGLGDPNPHFLDYPTLYMYFLFLLYTGYFVVGVLSGTFGAASDFAIQYFYDPTWFYLIGRASTAILGSLTVLVVYKAGKRLFDKEVGLLAALFFALIPGHVRQSHFALTDVPMTFLVVLSFYFCILILEEEGVRNYLLAGLLAGLAAATKYSGGLVIILLPVAHFMRCWKNTRRIALFLHKGLFVGASLAVIGFVIGCPYCVLDFPLFSKTMVAYSQQSQVSRLGMEEWAGKLWIAVFSIFLRANMGLLLEVLSLLGLGYCLIFHRGRGTLLLSFPLAFYVFMINSNVSRNNYWLPILPMLTIAAARLITELVHRIPPLIPCKLYVVGLSSVLVVVPLFVEAIRYDYLVSQKDTRIIAKEWIEDNVPGDRRIALESYGPPLEENEKAILDQLAVSQGGPQNEATAYLNPVLARSPSQTNARYVLMATSRKSASGKKLYYVYELWSLGKNSMDYYREQGYSYLIVSSYTYDRYLRAASRFPKTAQFYRTLFLEGTLVKEFKPNPVNRPGPTIKIFTLNTKNE